MTVPARRGASALAAALVGLVLTACGVTTTTQAYDASLIRQVGTGSDAVASVFPTLQAEAKQSTSNFSNPQTSQETVLLFQGRLDKSTLTTSSTWATPTSRALTTCRMR